MHDTLVCLQYRYKDALHGKRFQTLSRFKCTSPADLGNFYGKEYIKIYTELKGYTLTGTRGKLSESSYLYYYYYNVVLGVAFNPQYAVLCIS